MDKTKIFKYLEELRDTYINEEALYSLPVDDIVSIDGKEYERNFWLEKYQDNILVIFKVESKAILGSSSFCLGLQVSTNGTKTLLTNENLWEIGIP